MFETISHIINVSWNKLNLYSKNSLIIVLFSHFIHNWTTLKVSVLICLKAAELNGFVYNFECVFGIWNVEIDFVLVLKLICQFFSFIGLDKAIEVHRVTFVFAPFLTLKKKTWKSSNTHDLAPNRSQKWISRSKKIPQQS